MILINNNDELQSFLETAEGGETVSLAAGDYALNLNPYNSYGINYAKGLTFTSQDADNPAVFKEFQLTGNNAEFHSNSSVANIRMEGVDFKYDFSEGDAYTSVVFKSIYVDGLELVDCNFHGDVASGLSDADNGYATGAALNIRNSDDILIEGCSFSGFWAGLGLGEVTNAEVLGNEFTEMRSEGINLQQVQGLIIDNNEFSNFYGSLDSIDHRDMIQMWSVNPTFASRDILISNNVFDSGDGSETQSIFLNNEHVSNSGDESFFYENIRIENNVIYNAQFHGISVGQTNGLVVSNNTLLQNRESLDEGAVSVPSLHLHQDNTDVTLTNNLLSNEPALQADWIATNNYSLDGAAHDYKDKVNAFFADALHADGDGLADLYQMPDSILTQNGIGADLSKIDAAQDLTTGLISISDDGLNRQYETLVFSLEGMVVEGRLLNADEIASVTWTVDGVAKGSGASVEAADIQAGRHVVTGEVQLTDGTLLEASKTFVTQDSILHSIDASTPLLNAPDHQIIGAVDQGIFDGRHAIDLNGGALRQSIDPSNFSGTDEFTLSIGLNFSQAVNGGYPFAISGGVSINFVSNGIYVGIGTSTGAIWLHSTTNLLGQPGWQDVQIAFSSRLGEVRLLLNDEVIAQAEVPTGSQMAGNFSAGITLGYFDISRSFDGHISGLEILSYLEHDDRSTVDDPVSGPDQPLSVSSDSVSPEGVVDVPTPPEEVDPPVLVAPLVTIAEERELPDVPVPADLTVEDESVTVSPDPVSPEDVVDVPTPPEEVDPPVLVAPLVTIAEERELPDVPVPADLTVEDESVTVSPDPVSPEDVVDVPTPPEEVDPAVIAAPLAAIAEERELPDVSVPADLTVEDDSDIASPDAGEMVVGSERNVTFTSLSNDILAGGRGVDLLHGRKGKDDLSGNGGADTLLGGAGDDTLDGGRGMDLLRGGKGKDDLSGSGGADTLLGGAGKDRLDGGRGVDLLQGGKGKDDLSGNGGADTLLGGAGDDTLDGGRGADNMQGQDGRDLLIGGGGNDTLFGGRGRDELTGGDGRDYFGFDPGSDFDTITDFTQQADKILINWGAYEFGDLQISQLDDDVLIRFANVKVRVEDQDVTAFDASDFVFS